MREYKAGSKRADIIVITKCPKEYFGRRKILIKINSSILKNQKIFFSFIRYKSPVNYLNNKTEKLSPKDEYFLLTGIGNSKPLLIIYLIIKLNSVILDTMIIIILKK